MSLDGALDAATSALQAQSKALSIISDNIANSSTTGYKAVDVSFSSLLAGASTTTSDTTGGVTASGQQNLYAQGLVSSTNTSTNMAINGNGLFVVSSGTASASTTYAYTRDGDFGTDSNGYLTENGYTLMGWPTDSTGAVSASDMNTTAGLQAINVDRYSSSAAPTTAVTAAANLPADATAGSSYTTSIEVYDSLGTAEEVPVTWTKGTVANEWTMSIGNPTDASTGASSGTIGGITSYTIDFNSDGTLGTISYDSGGTATTVSAPTITVASWSDGANTTTDGSITLDLGTSGKSDGLTQYATGETDPTVNPTITKNGIAYGTLKSVSIGSDGTVSATYSNNQSVAIYKVAVATFANEDGLQAESNNVYEETSASGSYRLNIAGQDGAGSIEGSALEGSTTDTSSEFSQMIVAQQAYSAASSIITTDKDMFTALMNAVG